MSIKPNNDSRTIQYKYFDESEWRIIFSEEVRDLLKMKNRIDVINRFHKPEEIENNDFRKVLEANATKPKYLIPIKDMWFSMIIYPSLQVKVMAQADPEITDLMKLFKPKPEPEIFKNCYGNTAGLEPYNLPIELDLDACRNF